MSLELGYWDIRGLAEAIRMLLTHLEVPFNETSYTMGPKPDCDRSQWLSVKETLGLDFPNLPYLIDGEFKLTESRAILKYICEKYRPEYLGVDLEQQIRTEEISSLALTISNRLYTVIYDPEYTSKVAGVLGDVKVILERIGKTLERSRFLVGSQVTYVDFAFFELLQLIAAMQPGYLTTISANFVAYQAHFRSLPHIVEFENRHSPRLNFCSNAATFNAAAL